MKNVNDISIRKAYPEDAETIYSIMKQVESALPDKSIYLCDDLDYVRKHIENNGFAVVACNAKNEIIASFIFRYPGNSNDNLGRDIGMSDAELLQVVHMESVVVLPEYRSMGLQTKMLTFAEALIDHSRYRHFLATVSPDNPASYRSFEKCGYELVMTKEKYGGLLRRIYKKSIAPKEFSYD